MYSINILLYLRHILIRAINLGLPLFLSCVFPFERLVSGMGGFYHLWIFSLCSCHSPYQYSHLSPYPDEEFLVPIFCIRWRHLLSNSKTFSGWWQQKIWIQNNCNLLFYYNFGLLCGRNCRPWCCEQSICICIYI